MSEIDTPIEQSVRERAYYLWEQDGRPEGRDWEFWYRASQDQTDAPSTVEATGQIDDNQDDLGRDINDQAQSSH